MSATTRAKSLPPHATLHSQTALDAAKQATQAGLFNLLPHEEPWKDRQRFLQKKGYILRRRYVPGWKPSWSGTNLQPMFCEDAIALLNEQILDATRSKDGELVAIKVVKNENQELKIAQYLSSLEGARDHCVQVLQVLADPVNPKCSLMVLPFLRQCNDPEFQMLGEVIDFVDQSIEGLLFLHKHSIAHRDVAVENIMMDARPLYPQGYHPVRTHYSRDGVHQVSPLTRTDRPVKYYYIDFDLSVKFAPGASHLVVGDVGRDETVPELSSDVPYDAFKADIYALGNLYATEFEEKYHDFNFLLPMLDLMKRRRPDLRPPMDDIIVKWREIKATVGLHTYRWRLRSKSEPAIERVFNDTVAAAWEGINQLKKLVK